LAAISNNYPCYNLTIITVSERTHMAKYLLFKLEDLLGFTESFFRKYGVSPEDAHIAADVLLSADLRGVESHGLIRLYTYYGSRLEKKLIDVKTPLTVVQEGMATVAMDAGDGLGQVAAYHAMQRAIEKARQVGVGMTTVRNSNHYGIAGYYAMMALPENMIGISFTNAQPLVAPTHGRTAILGTNPIAVAAPANKEKPFVLDMATSIVPIGRVTVYNKANQPIPEGWGIDKDGKVTTDPAEVLQGGALLPLGGTDILRGYKGYGLALLVDIFSGVLAGSAFGADVAQPGTNASARVGHFFAALRIDSFRPVEEFKQDMDTLIHQMKNAPRAAGEERIYIHGEKEFELEAQYRENGVPVMEPVVEQLKEAGAKAGVAFDLTSVGEVNRSKE